MCVRVALTSQSVSAVRNSSQRACVLLSHAPQGRRAHCVLMGLPEGQFTWESIFFLLAGCYNLAIIIVSKGFTNQDLFSFDPLFSRDGCICVVLWGLAYMAMATSFRHAPFISLVFGCEKLLYYTHWHICLARRGAKDAKSAAFFVQTYGAGDLAFGFFFFYVFGSRVASYSDASVATSIGIGVAVAILSCLVPLVSVLYYLKSDQNSRLDTVMVGNRDLIP